MPDHTTKPEPVRLLLFNPDTDYALAAGRANYCPPAPVARFAAEMALFPALYARPGDVILVPEGTDRNPVKDERLREALERNNLTLVSRAQLPDLVRRHPDLSVVPWGWNHTLRRSLLAAGVPRGAVKTEAFIDSLRTLSHRRHSIDWRRKLSEMLTGCRVPHTEEITGAPQAEEFLQRHRVAWFKLPWSSSGRGVVRSDTLPHERLMQWIGGGICTQGSVMAEEALDGTADFASEWTVEGGKVRFMGMSWFTTASGGRYGRNLFCPQPEILARIREAAPFWNESVLEAQRHLIETSAAPSYEGPLGIDMLALSDGRVCPFVEANLRMTMGLAAALNMK